MSLSTIPRVSQPPKVFNHQVNNTGALSGDNTEMTHNYSGIALCDYARMRIRIVLALACTRDCLTAIRFSCARNQPPQPRCASYAHHCLQTAKSSTKVASTSSDRTL